MTSLRQSLLIAVATISATVLLIGGVYIHLGIQVSWQSPAKLNTAASFDGQAFSAKHKGTSSSELVFKRGNYTDDNATVRTPTLHINPGCLKRSLGSYKPVEAAATHYKHPSVVHYAKLSTRGTPVTLTFMDYMAMMSAYKFLQPSEIIVHTYGEISGKYWDLAQKWNTTVRANKVARVSTLSGRRVSYVQHQADFIKVRSLLEFGGVTSDFDVIVVNGTKMKHMQNISECVLSQEGEYLNNGFTSCIKNSSFVQRWVDAYHTDYKPESWLHNASFKPAGFLQDKKNAICYNMYVVDGIATHPAFSKAGTLWKQRNGVDWRGKVAAHYFDKSIRKLGEGSLGGDSSIAELLRHVRDA